MAKKRKYLKKKEKKKKPKFDVHSDTIKSLWGIIFLILFFLSALSFLDMAGGGGELFKQMTGTIFGWGSLAIPVVLLVVSYILFHSWKRNTFIPLVVGGILFFSGILGILDIFSGTGAMLGGYWGYILAMPFHKFFGTLASFVIFTGFILASVVLSFNIKLGKIIADRKERLRELRESVKEHAADMPLVGSDSNQSPRIKVKTWKDEEGQGSEVFADDKKSDAKEAPPVQQGKDSEDQTRDKAINEPGRNSPKDKSFVVKDFPGASAGFRLPPAKLLEKETGKPSSGDIVANANIIKRTLQNFGIEVEMDEVNVGPTVTQFTLKPAEGVKLARIMSLNNDLSLALASYPIRIEAPIPGRSLVGVEIPNKGFSIVRLKNLLESEQFKGGARTLSLCLGRDVSGRGVYANLASMPHMLIAGSTGSGKTICLNSIVLSLLYQHSPNTLKFILIDPKRVEFPVYSDIPHLLASIVVDVQKSIDALKWAVSEMERRFELLSSLRVRDIQAFNSDKKIVSQHGPLPYIVIIVDELADLMSSRGREMEALIVRLAQMARAVGIHLVLATQRPSVEVITGLIKANITSRIAFQVASQVDSRTVLDMAGAEKLLGNGDMLYLSGDASKPKRVQGAYVTEREVRRVADYLREERERMNQDNASGNDNAEERINEASFSPDLWNQSSGGNNFDFDDTESSSDDDLYEEAKETVIRSQKASASLLQRRLRIGYARAARLVDMLEENGIVGPGEGAKPREVYARREEEGEV